MKYIVNSGKIFPNKFIWVVFLFVYIFNIALFFKFGYVVILISLLGGWVVFSGRFYKKDAVIFLFIILAFFLNTISALINQNLDYSLFYEVYLFIIFQCLALIFVFRGLGFRIDFINLVKLSSIAVLVQLVISFMNSIYPTMEQLFYSVIYNNLSELSRLDELKEERIVGVGRSFFSSGVINSFILICLGQVIKYEKKYKAFWMLILILIFFLGMMSSRTTIVGMGLAIILLMLELGKNQLRTIFSIIFFTIIIFVLYLINRSDLESLSLFRFGFSLFYDNESSDAINSFLTLLKMFLVFPTNLGTWIIGDNLYNLENGYYMQTDVGYFRIIFANGLIGFLFFIIFNLYFIIKIKSEYIDFKFKFILFILLLILLLKGITVIIPLLMILYFACNTYGKF
ncbi:hypothetical protein [Acinetobacter sp. GXMZU3951]